LNLLVNPRLGRRRKILTLADTVPEMRKASVRMASHAIRP
jgi:hypothetical protein